MFSSTGANVLAMFFSWIWTIANMTLPGLSITLWQLFTGIFMISFVLRLVISLLNTHVGGFSYRSTSYQSKKSPNEPKAHKASEGGNND